jgi:hypothetical protein
MNDVLELIAATERWSRQSEMGGFFLQGTLWYGMMCRTFLLLERILRSVATELLSLAPADAMNIAHKRAVQGRPADRKTFGQCLATVEMLAPLVSKRVCAIHPALAGQTLLSDKDLILWRRAVFLRNRMAHQGPGFLDSVDLGAGRIWREFDEREPLEAQAKEIWEMCRYLCVSPLIVSYLALKGIAPDMMRAELAKIGESPLELQLSMSDQMKNAGDAAIINEFHVSSVQEPIGFPRGFPD